MTDMTLVITEKIFALLDARNPDATICPSEVARAIAPDNWRPLMPTIRAVASTLTRQGRLDIRQRGVTVRLGDDPRGPIRLGRPRS